MQAQSNIEAPGRVALEMKKDWEDEREEGRDILNKGRRFFLFCTYVTQRLVLLWY